jgi:hypothetical protein
MSQDLRDETFRAALKKTLLTRMVRTNSAVSKPPPTAPIVSEFYRIITTLNSICTSASSSFISLAYSATTRKTATAPWHDRPGELTLIRRRRRPVNIIWKKVTFGTALAAAALTSLTASPAAAQSWHGGDHRGGNGAGAAVAAGILGLALGATLADQGPYYGDPEPVGYAPMAALPAVTRLSGR